MAQNLTLRRAQPADGEALCGLIGQLGDPTSPDEMAIRLDRLLAHPEDHYVAVVEYEGRLIGVLVAALGYPIEHDGLYGRVTALCIDQNHRRRGVGALLLAHAEAWLRARGASACIVNSQSRRRDAHRFYEREGYAVTGLRFHKIL